MVKSNASVRDFCYRILRVCNVSGVIDNFCDTFRTCNTHCYHNKNHGKHHETHENVHAVGEKTHKFTCSQGTAYDHFGPKPADTKDTGVNSKLHQRHVHDNDLFST